MPDHRLPIYLAWADLRVSLKHNWFDRLPDAVRFAADTYPPEYTYRWDEEYPKLQQWLKDAELALSPSQILDLPVFDAWPSEFRQERKQWAHERFLSSSSNPKALIDDCLRKLKLIHPLIHKFNIGDRSEKQLLIDLLDQVATRIRDIPEQVEWSERPGTIRRKEQIGNLPIVLVIDDLLARDYILPATSEFDRARKAARQLRADFCSRFRLKDAESPEPINRQEEAIGWALFCPGQRWSESGEVQNDIETIAKWFNSHKDYNLGLVVVDVLFNTGELDVSGHGDKDEEYGVSEIIPWLKRQDPTLPIVSLTTESREGLIRNIRSDLRVDFLHRFSATEVELLQLIKAGGRATVAQLRAAMGVPDSLVAEHQGMIDVLLKAWIAAKDENVGTVLICGESGAGKERVAEFIHALSARAKKRMYKVNCSNLNSAEVARSELFGHVKGAFTGASENKKGLFELADGSTLMLDEFADLPPDVQTQLLRTLSEKRPHKRYIQPTGGIENFVNVRVICCTSQPLNQVREDMLFRIGENITIPPLRDRSDDILPLARYFLQDPERIGARGMRIDSEAAGFLQQIVLPGNARDLERLLKNATSKLGKNNILLRDDLVSEWEKIQKEQWKQPVNRLINDQNIFLGDASVKLSQSTPQDDLTLSEAVAIVLASHESEDGWRGLSLLQSEQIDGVLNGKLWKVLAALIGWAVFREEKSPGMVEYFSGRKLVHRAVDDALGRLLEADDKVIEYLKTMPPIAAKIAKDQRLTKLCQRKLEKRVRVKNKKRQIDPS